MKWTEIWSAGDLSVWSYLQRTHLVYAYQHKINTATAKNRMVKIHVMFLSKGTRRVPAAFWRNPEGSGRGHLEGRDLPVVLIITHQKSCHIKLIHSHHDSYTTTHYHHIEQLTAYHMSSTCSIRTPRTEVPEDCRPP